MSDYLEGLRNYSDRLTEALARIKVLEEALATIQSVVALQADDEALWSVPLEGTQSITEAYLQAELRRLHNLIEALENGEQNVKSK